jgi:molybdate transport system ATP-binding protein
MLEVRVSGSVGSLAIDVELDTGGGTLVIVGPNGAGKSSLLRMILGALEPASGRIAVGGRALFDSRVGVNVRLEDRALGYVPQSYALFPHLTVLENVEFVVECRVDRANGRSVRERAFAILTDLEMQTFAERATHTLSGGEKQRVALARALAAEPVALLLDEPLHALDVGARREVRSFLRSYLQKFDLPTIVVTHDAKDAAALGDRVAVLERGRVSQLGTWAELSAAPATPFVEELVTR